MILSVDFREAAATHVLYIFTANVSACVTLCGVLQSKIISVQIVWHVFFIRETECVTDENT